MCEVGLSHPPASQGACGILSVKHGTSQRGLGLVIFAAAGIFCIPCHLFPSECQGPDYRLCSAGFTFHSQAFPALWERSVPKLNFTLPVQEGPCWLLWNSGAFVTVRKAILPGQVLARAPCLEGHESSHRKAAGESRATVGQSVGGAQASPRPCQIPAP